MTMKIKVAAAAPEILPGQPGSNIRNVLDAVTQARADSAALLVLPLGLPEDIDREELESRAGAMTVYPLTRAPLSREELSYHHDMDVLCCSVDTPATAMSRYENENLAGLSSHENMAVVVMACPRGGDGNQIYTGQCVIAQNGAVLASEDGYVICQVNIPSRDVKAPTEGIVDGQSTTPWTPLPEMLPRILRLQGDALFRRMMMEGSTQLSVTVERDASSLLALAACVQAVDRLKISRKNIHAVVNGQRATQIAARLGVTIGEGRGGLAVDATDLTARAIDGAVPAHYAVNASIPRSVAHLVMRHFANTCGDRDLSAPIRSILTNDNEKPWVLYDFLLHFSMVYDLPKWGQARLLEDTFSRQFKGEVIHEVLDRFFESYRRPPSCDGPIVFPTDLKNAT